MTKTCLLILSGLLLSAPGEDGDVLFTDDFDTKLQPGWQWVREDKEEWRIRGGELQVRSQHGRIWGGNDAKNLLLVGPLKSRNMAARVSVVHQPKEKYEQAGPLWYIDDDNFVKLISEQIDGKMYVVVARELAGRGKVVGKVMVPWANVQLRLVVQGNRVTGQWRLTDTHVWSESGHCDFDAKGSPRFGLFTQNGAKDIVRWVRFDDFVVSELTER